jgi:inner membrane protein
MDSFTQVLLGAAVGEAVLGRRVGRKAMMWGAACGLLPDLDILVPFQDAVKNFTYHRSASHSLFVLALLTPIVVRLIQRLHPQTAAERNRWHLLVFSAFATHVLLDCFTVYGTQIFWPLPTPPVMWSTIFIIDPAYSIPLLVGVLAALVMSRIRSTGWMLNAAALVLSTLYLAWSVGAKLYVTGAAEASLARHGIVYDKVLTVPSPFNTLLWRVLAMDESGYHEGFYSLLDGKRELSFSRHESRAELLAPVADHWPVQRLRWFTHGFFAVGRNVDDVVVTDLRMGMEPGYVFRFKVAEIGPGGIRPTPATRVVEQRQWKQLRWVWQRIWQPDPAAAFRTDGQRVASMKTDQR